MTAERIFWLALVAVVIRRLFYPADSRTALDYLAVISIAVLLGAIFDAFGAWS